MAVWTPPKMDWTPHNGVMALDFNRIEGNIDWLRQLLMMTICVEPSLVSAASGAQGAVTGKRVVFQVPPNLKLCVSDVYAYVPPITSSTQFAGVFCRCVPVASGTPGTLFDQSNISAAFPTIPGSGYIRIKPGSVLYNNQSGSPVSVFVDCGFFAYTTPTGSSGAQNVPVNSTYSAQMLFDFID